MKKKYEDILLNSAVLVSKVPGVNMTGATAMASTYMNAYTDYQKVVRLLGVIAANIKQIDCLEAVIKKYKNEEDYDIEELQGQVIWYSERADKAYKELNEYISERESQNWR